MVGAGDNLVKQYPPATHQFLEVPYRSFSGTPSFFHRFTTNWNETMKFRLVYKGELLSTRIRPKKNQVDPKAFHKHEIRENFHYQIKNLLESDRVHDSVKNAQPVDLCFNSCFKFVPMVWKLKSAPDCSLNILCLRRDIPGSANHAGDIDNRLKTLLDALKVLPRGELPDGATPGQDQETFFCLFEDDSLVTHLSVEMDQLLDPPRDGGASSSEALIIVNVNIKPGLVTKENRLIL